MITLLPYPEYKKSVEAYSPRYLKLVYNYYFKAVENSLTTSQLSELNHAPPLLDQSIRTHPYSESILQFVNCLFKAVEQTGESRHDHLKDILERRIPRHPVAKPYWIGWEDLHRCHRAYLQWIEIVWVTIDLLKTHARLTRVDLDYFENVGPFGIGYIDMQHFQAALPRHLREFDTHYTPFNWEPASMRIPEKFMRIVTNQIEFAPTTAVCEDSYPCP